MTTTTSKSVPRSRLNITYRTRIDGRVVQKELPLRLLVAANFSGRGMKDAFGREASGRELPMLDRRLMYAIGKSGNLESVLKLMRIGLPVPEGLTHARRFRLSGHANVKITAVGEDAVLVQLQEAVVEGTALPSGDSGEPEALAIPDYQGQMQSFLGAEFSTRKVEGETVWSPSKEGELKLSGWLEPKRQSPREPAVMYEIAGVSELQLSFGAEGFDMSLVPQGGVEKRVRVDATVKARRVIPLLDMKSFDPERIAETVPEIRRLLVLRWLVSQGRSMIASNPILRNKCKDMLPEGAEQADADATESPLKVLRAVVSHLNADEVFCLRPGAEPKTNAVDDGATGGDAG